MKRKLKWNSVEGVDLPDQLEEWKKIRHLFPPSFLTVWIQNGKRCRRAYFDAANRRWIYSRKDHLTWRETDIVKNATAWAEDPENAFDKQLEEAKRE